MFKNCKTCGKPIVFTEKNKTSFSQMVNRTYCSNVCRINNRKIKNNNFDNTQRNISRDKKENTNYIWN